MRRLTDRQVIVLAAIERLGTPVRAELRREVTGLSAKQVREVVDALVNRGLVTESGHPARLHAVPRDRRPGRRGRLSHEA